MAISNNNVITYGASGKFAGQMVIRQRANKVVLCKLPNARKTVPSDTELQVREKFLEASIYAKHVMASEPMRQAYQAAAAPGQSAYNLALADACVAPRIKRIDPGAYTGAAGSTIRIRAIDNFKVQTVTVEIHSAAGLLLEKGNASAGENGLDWTYTATQANDALAGSKLIVQAIDLPGNVGMLELVL